jgi:hypothetical protein
MENNVANEKESLLLKVERQIFSNQEQFDDNFQKNDPPVDKNGMYELISALLHFLIFIF